MGEKYKILLENPQIGSGETTPSHQTVWASFDTKSDWQSLVHFLYDVHPMSNEGEPYPDTGHYLSAVTHFLGLAHSQVPSATMFATYSTTTPTAIRTLEADDEDGLLPAAPAPPSPASCHPPDWHD